MAKGPGPALLLAGAAALFLMSKKSKDDGKGSKENDEPKIDGKDEPPKKGTPTAPKAKSQEELKEEFEVEDDQVDPAVEVAAQAQWKVWPPGSNDNAANADHHLLFISDDCESALIGRDWKPIIESDGKLYDPASFWKEFGEGQPPLEQVEQIGSSQVNWFTRRLFDSKNALVLCGGEIPNPADYETSEGFDNAWTAFLNAYPAFAQAFFEVYHNYVKEPMHAAWAEVDPEGYGDWQLGELSEWAVENFPDEDETEQTDQAYFHWVEDDPDAPQVLDPDNPAHADYIEIWLAINEAIKDL